MELILKKLPSHVCDMVEQLINTNLSTPVMVLRKQTFIVHTTTAIASQVLQQPHCIGHTAAHSRAFRWLGCWLHPQNPQIAWSRLTTSYCHMLLGYK